MASLVVEAPRKILDAPRTLLLESMCAWLEQQPEFSALPNSEIVVTILPGDCLPPRYAGQRKRKREAVGCFAATRAGRLNPIWEVAIAYGPTYADEYDVGAWTTTLPHELLHLMAFAIAHHSKPPLQAGFEAIHSQAPNEEAIEDLARDIDDRFCAGHGQQLSDPRLLLAAADAIEAIPSL